MIRRLLGLPRRADHAPAPTTPATPRHARRVLISPRTTGGWEWDCLKCESGTGSAPTYGEADSAADIHHMTNHGGNND